MWYLFFHGINSRPASQQTMESIRQNNVISQIKTILELINFIYEKQNIETKIQELKVYLENYFTNKTFSDSVPLMIVLQFYYQNRIQNKRITDLLQRTKTVCNKLTTVLLPYLDKETINKYDVTFENTLLGLAMETNDTNIVELLFRNGVKVDNLQQLLKLLDMALKAESYETCIVLIEKVKEKEPDLINSVQLIHLLIKYHPLRNTTDLYNNTLTNLIKDIDITDDEFPKLFENILSRHIGFYNGITEVSRMKMIEALLKKMSNGNILNEHLWLKLLNLAVKEKDTSILKLMIEEKGAIWTENSAKSWLPMANNLEMLRYLHNELQIMWTLEEGINLLFVSLVVYENIEMFDYLLKNGAGTTGKQYRDYLTEKLPNHNRFAKKGNSLLHVAGRLGKMDFIKLLLEKTQGQDCKKFIQRWNQLRVKKRDTQEEKQFLALEQKIQYTDPSPKRRIQGIQEVV